MTDPRLKPKPLRPDSRVWDRVQYLLQWLVWKLVVYSPERPGIGAMITSVRLITFLLLIIGTGYGVWYAKSKKTRSRGGITGSIPVPPHLPDIKELTTDKIAGNLENHNESHKKPPTLILVAE
jgi:hypothetical protein